MEDENPIRTLGDYSKPSQEGYRNTIELPYGEITRPVFISIFLTRSRLAIALTSSAGDRASKHTSSEESWAILEDLALYDNESWNDPRDFTKPVKAIALPQDVLSTSDRHLIELESQVQRLMEAYLAQYVQVNKVSSPYEMCSDPHDTQLCMKIPEKAFVDYTSSRINPGLRISMMPPTPGGRIQTSIGHIPKPSLTHGANLSPFIPPVIK
ncbi:hypothetical protein Tco_1024314 [Tanacetum coccineum]